MPNRILLADDHAIVRQGLKALLEREGYSVVAEAGDGQEALREARERCPDVAVLDFSMPLLNGLDAARWNPADHGRDHGGGWWRIGFSSPMTTRSSGRA